MLLAALGRMATDSTVFLRRDPVSKQWATVPLADPAGDRLFYFSLSTLEPGLLVAGSGLVIGSGMLYGEHNGLNGLQGGSPAEYYHLTAAEHTLATQFANGSQGGLLSSADWTDFESKADSGPVGSSGLTQSTNRLLGRTTAGTGAIEELVAGSGLTLSAGTLSAVAGYGSVTAVTGTAPVVSSGGTTPAISMPVATASVNGYLASADWITFNSKEPSIAAGTTSQYWRGDKTWQTLDKTAVGLGNVLNTAQEPALGNPASNGQVLSSTTGGARSWITPAAGTVTSVTGTAPVVSSGGATPAISIPVATGSVNGYLSSADWTTFNSKASAFTVGPSLAFTGSVLDAIQDIRTSATPTFSTLNLTNSSGTVAFNMSAGAGPFNSFQFGARGSVIHDFFIYSVRTGNDLFSLRDTDDGDVATFHGAGLFGGPVSVNGVGSTDSAATNSTLYLSRTTPSRLNAVKFQGTAAFDTYLGTEGSSDDLVIGAAGSPATVRINAQTGAGTFGGALSVAYASGAGGTADVLVRNTTASGQTRVVFGNNAGAAKATFSYYGTTDPSRADEFWIRTESNRPVVFGVNDAEVMRLASGGNVGIGTTSPGSKLEVAGTLSTYSATGSGLITSETGAADGTQSGFQMVGPGNANWLLITNKSSLTGAADTLGIYKNAGTSGLKMAIRDNGQVAFKRFISTAGTPSATAKSAAGTGGTASITGTDSGFRLTVVVGTGPSTDADIAWIDYSTAFSSTPFVVMATATNLQADVYHSGNTASSIFFSVHGTLAAGATYKWDFIVTGS